MTEKFDPLSYWKDRHSNYRYDPRSVGNLTKSIDDNIHGASAIRHRLRKIFSYVSFFNEPVYVLDIACGVGRFSDVVSEFGFHYVGVDISPVALEQARIQCPTGTFIQADATSLSLDRHFHIVLSLYFLVHVVDDAKWEQAIGKMCQFVHADGFSILMDHVPNTRTSPARHVVERSKGDYEKALEIYGHKINKTEFNDCYLIGRKPIIDRLCRP